MTCPRYLVPPGYQLGHGITGPVDCSGWAASRAIAHATCGAQAPTGRRVRLLSDEPVPDPRSPGLNLVQVADVASRYFGVELDVCTGWRAVTWAEYERRRKAGAGCVIQLSYAPIADSRYDAGRGFRGGHAIFESQHDTIDSLADGRAPGVYDRDAEGVRVYPRNLMRRAAGQLVIGTDAKGHPRRVGDGMVWAAFTDALPAYTVEIQPRRHRRFRNFRQWNVTARRIDADEPFTVGRTGGFTADCTPPRALMHPDDRVRYLVQLTNGSRAGRWVNAKFARPK